MKLYTSAVLVSNRIVAGMVWQKEIGEWGLGIGDREGFNAEVAEDAEKTER